VEKVEKLKKPKFYLEIKPKLKIREDLLVTTTISNN
jgi:hypothetical protein